MNSPTALSLASPLSASPAPSSPSVPASDLGVVSSPATSVDDLPSDCSIPESFFVPQIHSAGIAESIQRLPHLKTNAGYLFVRVDHPDSNGAVGTLNFAPFLKAAGAALGDDQMFSCEKWSWMDVEYGNDEQFGYFTTSSAGGAVLQSETCSPTKVTHSEALNAFASAGLRAVLSLSLESNGTLYVLERPTFTFPPLSTTNPFGVPTREEWYQLWAAWDTVTLGMIPPCMLHRKPIDLRHKCLFYIGHIPTFLNILLSRVLNVPYTEPKEYTYIFERGIDPHVDDPDHCHNHSEVPEADEDWPCLPSVLQYRDDVRAKLMTMYDDVDSGAIKLNRRIARVLQMTLEHEQFHVETLLYMLIQGVGDGTLTPPGFTSPPWNALMAQWERAPLPDMPPVMLGPEALVVGHDDCETDDLESGVTDDVVDHEYGWDNESPKRVIDVGKFKVDWRPITNGQFCDFWRGEGKSSVSMPASWREKDGSLYVLSLHGLVPLEVARDWPCLTSYDDLSVYAKSKGGRIPTEAELRLFFDKYEVGFEGGANVGFRNWHPIPATTGLSWNGGKGSNGGVWEWTSDLFKGHPGLAPTNIFPGYSSDFFDGVHHVVIGASYVTVPRLACRRTVRNFYQHNYPYPWVGARIAYDA